LGGRERKATTMSRQCPRCSLFSPPGAVRCDCGHDFQTGKMEPSFVMADVIQKAGGAAKLLEQTGRSNMRTGAILFWLGAGFTVLTYLAGSIRPESQGGGGFFLFWGALVFGALQFLRGVDQRRKGRRLAEHAKRPGSGSAWTIDGVRFDTTGWQLQDASAATMIWTDPDGDVLSLSHVRGQADVPSGDDLPTLRARCRQLAAANNGGLVYADFVNGDGVRAVSLIYKREQLPAYAYTGMVIIPREATISSSPSRPSSEGQPACAMRLSLRDWSSRASLTRPRRTRIAGSLGGSMIPTM